MDWLLQDLEKIERRLLDELAELPQSKMLKEIRFLIDLRFAQIDHDRRVRGPAYLPQGRLLCEVVHEQHALAVWENEGGALASGSGRA